MPRLSLRDLDPAMASAAKLFAATFAGVRNDGIERSFKLSDGAVFPVRFGLCFRKGRLSSDVVCQWSQALHVPAEGQDFIHAYYAESRFVYFAFEQGLASPSCKLYFESSDFDAVRGGQDICTLEDTVILRAFKWNPLSGNESRMTEYRWMPRVRFDDMLARIGRCFSEGDDSPHSQPVSALLTGLARATGQRPCLYVEASESTTSRTSFDVNVYNTGARLADVAPQIEVIAHSHAVGRDRAHELLAPIRSHRLGHISGGIDARGRGFTTIYHR